MRTAPIVLASLLFAVAPACASTADGSGDATLAEDDLTAATARRLGVPLEVLAGVFYAKPSSIDQSGLGVVVAGGVAVAKGAGSQALPKTTTLDGVPFAALASGRVSIGAPLGGSFAAFFDYEDLVVDRSAAPARARLLGRNAPPLFAPAAMKEGLACRVLGTEMDMYARVPPKVTSLEGTVERMRADVQAGAVAAYQVVVRTNVSTGGEMSVLVCDGKLAGISAGAGSQGTTHEFRSVDAAFVTAAQAARAAAAPDCRRQGRCR